MTEIKELWVDRTDYRKTRHVQRTAPELRPGDVLVEIEKFALTANNVTYALSGDMIGYWKYYPAEETWGKVPVWGYGKVIASRHGDVLEGERVWGFFPMASHVVMTPGKVKDRGWMDAAEHRQALPPLYNQYARTAGEPDFLKTLEDERCLLFPLFVTSYVIYDFLKDNDFFGSDQVLIGSVSSKTGFGLAHLLHRDAGVAQEVVGLTSARNIAFVESLNVCDSIVGYGEEDKLDVEKPAVFVDMSGDGPLIETLFNRLGSNLKFVSRVGATHWESTGFGMKPPEGLRSEFFFAPSQIGKRDSEWGPGVMMGKAYEASAEIAASIQNQLEISRQSGPETVERSWLEMLDNKVPPSTGLMLDMT